MNKKSKKIKYDIFLLSVSIIPMLLLYKNAFLLKIFNVSQEIIYKNVKFIKVK
ncbi:hypothetical protein TREPR_3631 [Treponema primitia ZAS-2]|uniref:Uncharacterized protein n=1 Tax=Treponema primitia (strain ATCC BAA-887 / DSM 12427 / ZAS-2) TaxID=545694 RepID=F5YQZ6_TREPZ|nr:hypothetical protein TREPR_3631 [Treponema primitia ZAS-2]